VRPATEKTIREIGLKIILQDDEKIVFPDLITSDPKNTGKLDLLICCVKSYDLEESLKPLSVSIAPETIILPLLNGVDAKDRIAKIFPANEIWDGCVYIVTRLIEPGVIKESGNIRSLFFGSPNGSSDKLKQFENIFKEAGINAFLSANIEQTIWEKFLFISTIASLTSYLDLPIGAIVSNDEHRKMLLELMNELKSVATTKGIHFSEDIISKTVAKMEKLPYETTSSMHSDFQKGGRTEYISLTEYVVRSGKELKVKTPQYEKVLSALAEKQKN
jgi:2-dehydropantoate 2-reductase